MKPFHAIFAALAATSLFAVASESLAPLPKGWLLAGQTPERYKAGIDHTQSVSGKGAKYMRSVGAAGNGWGTLMNMFSAEKYRGQRVRLQARIKTRDVTGWAGLWMRVDTGSGISAFYNSKDKPIKGSTDWELRTVVLDVASNANTIALGVIEGGSGEVWFDDIKLEVVDKSVPVDSQTRELAKVPNL